MTTNVYQISDFVSSVSNPIGGSRGGAPGARPPPPPFAWHPSSLADLGGHARRAPPHLPGILVFDDILGHIV